MHTPDGYVQSVAFPSQWDEGIRSNLLRRDFQHCVWMWLPPNYEGFERAWTVVIEDASPFGDVETKLSQELSDGGWQYGGASSPKEGLRETVTLDPSSGCF